MKEERSIKELLEVMLENQELFNGGLCSWAWYMYREDKITFEEYRILDCYIRENRPSKFSSLEAWNYQNRGYYWKYNNIKPRIKWIKKHIKKLSK